MVSCFKNLFGVVYTYHLIRLFLTPSCSHKTTETSWLSDIDEYSTPT